MSNQNKNAINKNIANNKLQEMKAKSQEKAVRYNEESHNINDNTKDNKHGSGDEMAILSYTTKDIETVLNCLNILGSLDSNQGVQKSAMIYQIYVMLTQHQIKPNKN